MIQSGGFLPFSINENPFIKASEGVLSLVNSLLNESKNMAAKKIEDKIVDTVYLVKRLKKEFHHLMVQE